MPQKSQHKVPCRECPWRRDAEPGLLGEALDPKGWCRAAKRDDHIECHLANPLQCAGAARYRANIGKVPKDPEILVLPKDHKRVFSSAKEFIKHHTPGFRSEFEKRLMRTIQLLKI